MKNKGLTIIFFLSIIFFITVITSFDAIAQNKILLMNGVELEGKAEPIDSLTTKFNWKKKGKVKELVLDNGRIFSYTLSGTETLIYKYDPAIGNIFSIDEMRAYILGEQQAIVKYKAVLPSISSLGINSAFGATFASSVAILPAPIITGALFQIYTSKGGLAPDNMPENEKIVFFEGYKDTARPKKLKRTLLWGAIGLASGMVFHNLTGQ